MITLKQLRYFAALARQGHFGRAAAECAVSQPALSMQIRDMEKFLGVELVERRPAEVTLTAIGREIAARADQVLAGARDLVDFARHQGRLLTGQLRLGVIPTLAPYVLPKILPALQARYPELQVELRETQTRLLVEELSRGTLDVLLLALPIDEPEIETIALFDDRFVLAVAANDPRPETMPVDAKAIEREPLILLEEGHCLGDLRRRTRRAGETIRCDQPHDGDANGRQRLWGDPAAPGRGRGRGARRPHQAIAVFAARTRPQYWLGVPSHLAAQGGFCCAGRVGEGRGGVA
jgi:DNA-binding transcriptional LysR family regulator